jgi:hypothetical protein
MRKTTIAIAALLAAGLLATTAGCTRVRLQDRPETRTTSEHRTVALGGATTVDANLTIGVGQLRLSAEPTSTETTGTDLLVADFVYAPTSWKPEIRYAVTAGRVGQLEVSQPRDSSAQVFQNGKNEWDLALAGGIPTKLTLRFGVGTSDVDLRGIDVRELDAVTGVGATTIDLSGPRTSPVDVSIESGVGNLIVKVPRSMGVRVTGRQDGIGNFAADGFTAEGNAWVDAAYAGAGPKMEIRINRGVGDVTIVMTD